MDKGSPQGQPAAVQVMAELSGGGLRFGVDASRLLEVVIRPRELALVPRAGSCLVGVLDHRGRAVPVVDLHRWHSGSNGDSPDAGGMRVAVVTEGDQRIGILVDHTGEVRRMQGHALQQLHHDDNPNEFFHSVVPAAAQGQWLPVLDVGRLMAQARVWSGAGAVAEASGPSESATAGGIAAASPVTRLAVFAIGERHYGVSVEQVAAVLHRPVVQPMRSGDSDLMGFLTWRGQQIPLVQPSRWLQDGSAAARQDAAWVVVLKDADSQGRPRWLALACHRLDQVRASPSQPLQPMSALGEGALAPCLGFFYLEEARVVRVLDGSRMLDQQGMVQADSAPDADAPSASRRKPQPNRVGYVAFHAGGRMAVAIDRLQEILPFDGGGARLADGGSDTLTWRGQQLPLIDVAQRLGRGQGGAEGAVRHRVLVARVGEHLAGLLVGDVDLLIPAFTAEINRTSLPGGQELAYITAERQGRRESCHLLDLEALQA